MTQATLEQQELAKLAFEALLNQVPVPITHEAGYARNGWPLPIKRMAPSEDGTTTQQYRPMAILEFIQETLSGEAARHKVNDRRAEQRLPETDQCS